MTQPLINPKIIAILTIPLFIVVYLYFLRPADNKAAETINGTKSEQHPLSENINWKSVNLEKLELPADLKELTSSVKIQPMTVTIANIETFAQTADPPSGTSASGKVVLLLHGAAFTSQTWVDAVPTLASLAAMGHRVVAIDLPGYGKTTGHAKDKAEYLKQAMALLTPDVKPIVVSPSMSGSFVVPFLKDNSEKVSGWVPVAPAASSEGQAFFPSLHLPTMIVHGELDKGGSGSAEYLKLIPTSTNPQVLPKAKHPAYLDQPDLWHKLLYNFIKLI